MIPLLKLKKDIQFNNNLHSILGTMKSVSVFQFRMLEQKLKFAEPLEKFLGDFFNTIDLERIQHPFLGSSQGRVAVIAVTSDKGLLGGLNTRVVNGALGILKERGGILVVVGEQGKVYARHCKISFTGYPGIVDDARYPQAYELRDYLFQQLQEGHFEGIQVVYPRALSLVNYRIEAASLLPLTGLQSEGNKPVDMSQFIFESSLISILEYLAFLWVGQRLGDIFGMSRLAEMGARFTHLEEATQKIQELNQKLRLQYFKFRHEVIDQSMRELFAARALYAE
jgi:F-type H+-transporting ATPase subunit gamma